MNFKKGLSWVAVVAFVLGIVPSFARRQRGACFLGLYQQGLKTLFSTRENIRNGRKAGLISWSRQRAAKHGAGHVGMAYG